MIPRLWQFRMLSVLGALHAILAVLLLTVVLRKVWIIRVREELSHQLPLLGTLVLTLTLVITLLGIFPYQRVVEFQTATELSANGRVLFHKRCLQCHGSSQVAFVFMRSDKWQRELRKMQKYSKRSAHQDISDVERKAIAAFLIETRGYRKD
jgi:hypothetical protein